MSLFRIHLISPSIGVTTEEPRPPLVRPAGPDFPLRRADASHGRAEPRSFAPTETSRVQPSLSLSRAPHPIAMMSFSRGRLGWFAASGGSNAREGWPTLSPDRCRRASARARRGGSPGLHLCRLVSFTSTPSSCRRLRTFLGPSQCSSSSRSPLLAAHIACSRPCKAEARSEMGREHACSRACATSARWLLGRWG